MANAFHYSIGRKFIQAVSGAFLIVFLLLHGTINFFSVIDSFTGKFGAEDGLFQLGCDFMAEPAAPPYERLPATFVNNWVLIIYIIWFIAVFFHLTHGFWSMFQTVGWSNQVWMKRLKVIGVLVAAVILVLFTSVAVNAFIQA